MGFEGRYRIQKAHAGTENDPYQDRIDSACVRAGKSTRIPYVAVSMETWRDRVAVNPGLCGGRPCIRGMRIRVSDVLDLLASGLSRQQVLEELPDLEPEDIEAVLRYASSHLDHPVLAA